ncbi:transposase [Plakobranchus ocellatus]|uniref:Transposase n=1 Tax=Plakobranchus ocellatus TaxID=259542 RepID=A0AAV4DN61_9GAST|nr:transposase [Plakobranchus ocellatus]
MNFIILMKISVIHTTEIPHLLPNEDGEDNAVKWKDNAVEFLILWSAAISGCERCDPLRHFATGSVYQCCPICSTLDRLKEAIRRKRPGLLRRGVVLQHDNATPHSANLTQQWLQRYGWEILPHPAPSPDLAPSDCHLFGPLKRHLGGMAFETEDDLISELRTWFDNLDVDFFRVGINSLLSRWQKCIDLHGDYVE